MSELRYRFSRLPAWNHYGSQQAPPRLSPAVLDSGGKQQQQQQQLLRRQQQQQQQHSPLAPPPKRLNNNSGGGGVAGGGNGAKKNFQVGKHKRTFHLALSQNRINFGPRATSITGRQK